MVKSLENALFIFRRDLRLEDNSGLIFALKHAKKVIPCFIFTPEQIDQNPYRSNHCLQFMIECLQDLDAALKKKKGHLFLFFGKTEKIVEKCIQKLGVDAVVVNRDYTPYSTQRDQKINIACKKYRIPFLSFDDVLLHPPEETLKSNGTPYTIFTPFYRKASQLKVSHPRSNRFTNYYSQPISFAERNSLYKKILPEKAKQLNGGRRSAIKILKGLKKYSDYKLTRDFPAKKRTTHLSAHLKFTTCSVREIYQAVVKELGSHSELIRSLYWRDFFTTIAFHFPKVFKGAFHPKFNRIQWSHSKQVFKRWCDGTTGFPIIDAGMREMNQTGYMQNRIRMISASFLVKDLHIDWRWGEKYFAQKLIDYDPAVNNGNWQWAASTGCDAQPYFRIFNPWAQQIKFDPECSYIKHWITELSSLPSEVIHNWYLEKYRDQGHMYPGPLVDHAKEAKLSLVTYKKAAIYAH